FFLARGFKVKPNLFERFPWASPLLAGISFLIIVVIGAQSVRWRILAARLEKQFASDFESNNNSTTLPLLNNGLESTLSRLAKKAGVHELLGVNVRAGNAD